MSLRFWWHSLVPKEIRMRIWANWKSITAPSPPSPTEGAERIAAVLVIAIVVVAFVFTMLLKGCESGRMPTAPTAGAVVTGGSPSTPVTVPGGGLPSGGFPTTVGAGVVTATAHNVHYVFDFASQSLEVRNLNQKLIWATVKRASGGVLYDSLVRAGRTKQVSTLFARGDRITVKLRYFDVDIDFDLPPKPSAAEVLTALKGLVPIETVESSFSI